MLESLFWSFFCFFFFAVFKLSASFQKFTRIYVSVVSNDRSKGTEVDVLPTVRGNNLQNRNVIIYVLILLHHYVVSFLIF